LVRRDVVTSWLGLGAGGRRAQFGFALASEIVPKARYVIASNIFFAIHVCSLDAVPFLSTRPIPCAKGVATHSAIVTSLDNVCRCGLGCGLGRLLGHLLCCLLGRLLGHRLSGCRFFGRGTKDSLRDALEETKIPIYFVTTQLASFSHPHWRPYLSGAGSLLRSLQMGYAFPSITVVEGGCGLGAGVPMYSGEGAGVPLYLGTDGAPLYLGTDGVPLYLGRDGTTHS
jgi:hypothetical protein